MRKIGNRLLITLVLFGVLSAAAAHAQTSLRLGKSPTNPLGWGATSPPAAPSAGEPDVGSTSPQRTAQAPLMRVDSPQTSSTSLRTNLLVTQLRWAWVMWMARYLNLPL